MSGSKIGGIKTAKTNKKLYGKNFYKEIGAKGGKAKGLKGFALNKELARTAGAKGGAKSVRSNTIVTAKNVYKILELHEKGMMASDIAKKLKLTPVCVRYHIRKHEDFAKFEEQYNG